MNGLKLKYFIVFIVATILIEGLGSIFNFISIPAAGLNRYLAIFIMPLIFYLVKAEHIRYKYFGYAIAGGCFGLFFSDISDFVATLPRFGIAIMLVFAMYMYLLVNLWTVRRRHK